MDVKQWWFEQEEQWKNDPEYLLEKLKIKIMEDFLEVMERKNVSRSELAKRLGCSNAYITKLLQGTQNLTLQKLVEIALVLDCDLSVAFTPRRTPKAPSTAAKVPRRMAAKRKASVVHEPANKYRRKSKQK